MELETLKPFDGYMVNPALEMMGVTAYIGLAQSLQRMGDAAGQGETLSIGESGEVLDALCMALTYMQASGIAARHPDLEAIPDEVEPLDFMGGEGELERWFAEELADCVISEQSKLQALLN